MSPSSIPVETQVREKERFLDGYQERSSVHNYDPAVAIWHCLVEYDLLTFVEGYLEAHLKSPALTQEVRQLRDGYIQACKWLYTAQVQLEAEPPFPIDLELLKELASYIQFGGWYTLIADHFRMYGRGNVEAVPYEGGIDLEYFPNRDAWPVGIYFGGAQEFEELSSAEHVAFEQRRELIKAYAQVPVRTGDGYIVLSEPERLPIGAAVDVYSAYHDYEDFFDLSRTLGSFTIGDFNRYWIAFRCWSECALIHYLRLLPAMKDGPLPPTQCVFRKRFENKIAKLSRLSREVVRDITDYLLFDPNNEKRDSILSPLFQYGDSIAWSVSAVNKSRQPRNIMKLLSRNPTTSNLAATIIGERERSFVAFLARFVKDEYGWEAEPFIGLGAHGEIDLIVWDVSQPDRGLVVEVKAILDADELNEVYSATEALRDGQQQVVNAITWLQQNDPAARPTIPFAQIGNYVGVVMAPNTDPDSSLVGIAPPAVNWQTLKRKLKTVSVVHPSDLYDVACGLTSSTAITRNRGMVGRVKVGDVGFGIPYFTEDAEAAAALGPVDQASFVFGIGGLED